MLDNDCYALFANLNGHDLVTRGIFAFRIRLNSKSFPCHFSDSTLHDPAPFAIIGFKPIGKLLRAFA
jgi:hypothetical protein